MNTSDRSCPRLGREMLQSGGSANEGLAVPSPAVFGLPETIVQFGTGAFLRGFVDFFIDEAIRRGAYHGRVVAIGSTPSGRDGALNEQDGLYTLVVEGTGANGPRRECRVVGSVSRALSAAREWNDVLGLARQPALDLVFSNTTEIGISLEAGDVLDAAPPPSFPGKLARFLLERGRAFGYADEAGLVVVPCELIERNGEKLRALVLTLARRWNLESAFDAWIDRAVPFCNTLVDRIVPGAPDETRRRELERELGYSDDLLIAAEPYRLFVIECDAKTRTRLAFAAADPRVVLTDDVTPFRERKVRILNGGHTILASVGLLAGCVTVLDGMRHAVVAPYLERLLFEDIVPSLDVPEGRQFARDVLLRFGNPYLRHALRDITVQHTAKMRVRVIPSVLRFAERARECPPLLAFGFAGYLLLIRAGLATAGQERSISLGADSEGERIRELWRAATDNDETTLRDVVDRVCRDTELWQADLSRVPGFAERVGDNVVQITRKGIAAALAACLAQNGSGRVAVPALSSKS